MSIPSRAIITAALLLMSFVCVDSFVLFNGWWWSAPVAAVPNNTHPVVPPVSVADQLTRNSDCNCHEVIPRLVRMEHKQDQTLSKQDQTLSQTKINYDLLKVVEERYEADLQKCQSEKSRLQRQLNGRSDEVIACQKKVGEVTWQHAGILLALALSVVDPITPKLGIAISMAMFVVHWAVPELVLFTITFGTETNVGAAPLFFAIDGVYICFMVHQSGTKVCSRISAIYRVLSKLEETSQTDARHGAVQTFRPLTGPSNPWQKSHESSCDAASNAQSTEKTPMISADYDKTYQVSEPVSLPVPYIPKPSRSLFSPRG